MLQSNLPVLRHLKARTRSPSDRRDRITFGSRLPEPSAASCAEDCTRSPRATAHLGAATGFAAALALRAAKGKPFLWARQEFLEHETGRLNASGLVELGFDPERIILVKARDAEGVLRAGEQAVRCAALGAVLMEPWGEPKTLDFTASRRLSLVSAKSGVPILMLRVSASPAQSAATTRWKVRSLPSRALEANAPGFPAFELNLLRQRAAWRAMCGVWSGAVTECFEDLRGCDVAPVSRPVVPVSHDGSAAAAERQYKFRKAG